MSRFLNLSQFDAYEQFAVTLRGTRGPMERAYLAAIDASNACNDMMDESRRLRALAEDPGTFEMFGLAPRSENPGEDIRRSEGLHLNAEVEDMQADWQASVVVLFADNLLQRFERRVLPSKQGSDGYGPTYNYGVRFTTLLRAGGNAIRHVSDWDDNELLKFPYDAEQMRLQRDERRAIGQWSGEDETTYRNAMRAWDNIRIFQHAFGIGKHERIREMQSWRVLCTVDGLYGTHPPDYGRVENAIVAAAREIAAEAGDDACKRLDAALTGSLPEPVDSKKNEIRA